MKRKALIFIIISVFTACMTRGGMNSQAASPDGKIPGLERTLERVRIAFETRPSCRDLFTRYQGDPRKTLEHAQFVYVGDELKPMGFAAATVPGANETFIGTEVYEHLSDIDGVATLLIHELLHQQGAGSEIDSYLENYELISRSCGTKNSAK
jgi:hypothetical protein